MRIENISKLLNYSLVHEMRLYSPFVMMAHRNNSVAELHDESTALDKPFTIHPMWIEFVEHDSGRSEPEQLRDFMMNKARGRAETSKWQTLANWMELPAFTIHGVNRVYLPKMLGLRDLIDADVLNPGDDGEVTFNHAPMFGLGSVCAFWADSVGAAQKFLRSSRLTDAYTA